MFSRYSGTVDPLYARSKGIPEAMKSLNDHLSLVGLPVAAAEVNRQDANNHEDQGVAGDSGVDAWPVPGRVL